jgi:hypothetical protein
VLLDGGVETRIEKRVIWRNVCLVSGTRLNSNSNLSVFDGNGHVENGGPALSSERPFLPTDEGMYLRENIVSSGSGRSTNEHIRSSSVSVNLRDVSHC